MHHKEFLQTKADVKLDMTIREPKVKFEKLFLFIFYYTILKNDQISL